MKISLLPLFSKLNPGLGNCPLGCQERCLVAERSDLQPEPGHTCPLSSHQAETCAESQSGTADVTFNEAETGDGKSLGASLPALLDPTFRLMALYPTIELVEDQKRQQKDYHRRFRLAIEEIKRIDSLYGEELDRRVSEKDSNKFNELLKSIENTPILLTNPDIFHLIVHHRYHNPAYGKELLPVALADFPQLWVCDEFHIFGPHQEAATLNSLTLIRRVTAEKKRFLFTSATPRPSFVEQLQRAGLTVRSIRGEYANQRTFGYRPILQPVTLDIVSLGDSDSLTWLSEQTETLRHHLEAEGAGRGLIILNSIAKVNRVVRVLKEQLPGIEIEEISGRIDRRERKAIQERLQHSSNPVLVVATSAVDVGVDFRIHLLVFESSNSATVIQRLGRLGRHPGFSQYQAYLLVPGQTPWVMSRLEEKLSTEEAIARSQLREAIEDAFEPPKAFEEYRQRWGALQAQGLLEQMVQNRVSKPIRQKMQEDFDRVYPDRLESARKWWFKMKNDKLGRSIQDELLRFRGGTALQAAVWDETQGKTRFYTYDLLRLLPHAMVELLDRETFIKGAIETGYSESSFPDRYVQVYLRVTGWLDDRLDLSLKTHLDSEQLTCCELTELGRLSILEHPNSSISRCLRKRKLLAFLVPVDSRNSQSHWQVSKKLQLSPLFGLYRLTDAENHAYACAFNQDALLLDALKHRLKKFCRGTVNMIF
ncbi:type I-D CRISPR-associated helicase Cas3' [Baaleninema simplex]|uniref:type I-D CRISPR-associated helicase Cas3' n=1 Tax=Baaleninema simplex TaxID=2862350 RepID=UPI00034571E7|nr:type I-D CRISPR-associated helicase Cas3' [Baaleninema simplex]